MIRKMAFQSFIQVVLLITEKINLTNISQVKSSSRKDFFKFEFKNVHSSLI